MATSSPRILVLGAGYAGTLAAVRLARLAPAASITLISDRPTFVERVRLHQVAAGQRIPERPLAEVMAGRRVELQVGEVVSLDPTAQRVVVRVDRREHVVGFDRVVVCAGSVGARATVEGAEHTFDVGDLREMIALSAMLPRLERRDRVVVCGGGLSGIEVAAEIAERHRGLGVTLVSRGDVGEGLPVRARAHIAAALAGLGVELREHARVGAFEPGAVLLEGGEVLPSSATVWAMGMVASPMGAEAGLVTASDGRIVVDHAMRSISHPVVYAAGDCALSRPHGEALSMACATALPMAAQAATSLVAELEGREAEPFRYGFTGRCISLGRRDGLIAIGAPAGGFTGTQIAGRAGAVVKELVCRFAGGSARAEARGLFAYRWLRPALPAPRLPEVAVR